MNGKIGGVNAGLQKGLTVACVGSFFLKLGCDMEKLTPPVLE